MGSDDLYHKRKAKTAQAHGRKQPKQAPYERVLIVCEGKKTEPNYFLGLRKALGLHPQNVVIADKNQWVSEEREAFTALSKSDFAFNPKAEGELAGAEKLAQRHGAWAQVWQRFAESPQLYPKLPDLLRKTALPSDLFSE